jgi:hypothetical protein
MMSILAATVTGNIRNAAELWGKDLRAHAAEKLTEVPAATARSIADITWETVAVNRRIAARLRGEAVPPAEGFPVCPPELANVESLVSEISASAEEVIASIGDDPDRTVELPDGPSNVYEYADFAAIHMFYHLGQINYAQTLYGDTDVHWHP